MQIRELYIDGFGVFRDHVLSGLSPGLNILRGRNEAGKTTLLQFIRFTLFGYPHSIEQRLPPVRGGDHGGRIKALTADNREVVFERKAGYPGETRLHFPGGQAGLTDDWQQLLGHGSAGFFNNVYGISLDELVSLAALSDSGVEDKIFSVGLGLAASSLGDMEEALSSQLNEIYKSRGSRQRVPRLKKALDEKNRQIREIQNHLPRYSELTTEINQLQAELAAVTAAHEKRKAERERLDNYLKCYESYVIIRSMDQELEQLPSEDDYPENGPAEMERLEEEERRLHKSIAELRRKQAGYEKSWAALSCNRSLLDCRDTVEYLAANLEKYKTWQQEYRQDSFELEELTRSIQQRLRSINSDWTETDLSGLSGLVGHRDRLREFGDSLSGLEDQENRAEIECATLRARRSGVHVARGCALLALLFLLAAVPCFMTGQYWWGGTLVVAGLLLFAGRDRLKAEEPLKEAEERLAAICSEKQRIITAYRAYLETSLGLEASLSPASALEIIDRVEQLRADIHTRDKYRRRLADKKEFLDIFKGKANGLARHLPPGTAGVDNGRDTTVLASQIIAASRKAADCHQEKSALEKKISETREAVEAAEQELRYVRSGIDQLLSAVAAGDRDEFKKKYRQSQRRRQAADQRARALQTMDQIAGRGTADQVLKYLDETDKQELEGQRAQAEQTLTELTRHRDELNRQISALVTERNQFRTTSDLAAVMTEAATTREQLEQARQEWLAAGAARRVLEDVKKQYEQDKQPAVIRNSSAFFEEITEGRYPRIHVSLEDRDVLVFDRRESPKKIEQLSRGTREQLLISLRLGFIEEFEKTAEPLPLVLDEVLVNFDRDRAGRAARLFHRFARERQVLLFTCHDRLTRLFDGLEITTIDI